MCDSDPPAPPPAREPEVLVNPFDDLDNEERRAAAARRGTSSLRVPRGTGLGIGFSGRGGTAAPTGISPPPSTGLAIPAGQAPAPRSHRSSSYTPFADTAGLGHAAQQRQQQLDDQLVRKIMVGMAL